MNWKTKTLVGLLGASIVGTSLFTILNARDQPTETSHLDSEIIAASNHAQKREESVKVDLPTQISEDQLTEIKEEIAESDLDETFEYATDKLEEVKHDIEEMQSAVAPSQKASERLRQLAEEGDLTVEQKEDVKKRANEIDELQAKVDHKLKLIESERKRLEDGAAETQRLIKELESAENSGAAEATVRRAEERLQILKDDAILADANLDAIDGSLQSDLNSLSSKLFSASSAYEADLNYMAEDDEGLSADDIKAIAELVKTVAENLPEIVDALKEIGEALLDGLEFLGDLLVKLYDLLKCVFGFSSDCGSGSGGGSDPGSGKDKGPGQNQKKSDGNKGGDPSSPEGNPSDDQDNSNDDDGNNSDISDDNTNGGNDVQTGIEQDKFDDYGNVGLDGGDVKLPTELGDDIENVGATYESTGPDQKLRFNFKMNKQAKTFAVTKVELQSDDSERVIAIYIIDAAAGNPLAETVVQTIGSGTLVKFDGVSVNGSEHTLTFAGLPAAQGVPVRVMFEKADTTDEGYPLYAPKQFIDLAVSLTN